MAREFFLHPSKDKTSIFPPPSDENYGTAGTSGAFYSTSGIAISDYDIGTNNNIGVGNLPGNVSTGIGNYNQILSELAILNGKWNMTGQNADNIIIIGNNNLVSSNTSNCGILGGNNNTIESDVTNSWIVGSNLKLITQSNEIWIGDSIHILDGELQTIYQFVDGGNDYNVNINFQTPFTVIDGGLDQVFEEFSTEPIHIVDGGLDTFY